MMLCSSCGQSIYPGQNFCLECGAALSVVGRGSDATAPMVVPAAPTTPIYAPLPSAGVSSPQFTSSAQIGGGRGNKNLLIICALLATASVSVAVTVMVIRSKPESTTQSTVAYPLANYSSATANESRSNNPPRLRITATASSVRAPMQGNYYEASNVLDGNWKTGWVEGVGGPGIGEWIRCDFDREVTLRKIMITPGYFKTPKLWAENNRLARATFYFSDGSSRSFSFPDRMEVQTLIVSGIRTRSVRMVLNDFYPGSVDSEDTPVSELSFDWEE